MVTTHQGSLDDDAYMWHLCEWECVCQSVCIQIASPFTHAVSSMKVFKGNVKKNVWLFGPTFEKIISLNDKNEYKAQV